MIGAGRVLADVFGAAELLKIQDLPLGGLVLRAHSGVSDDGYGPIHAEGLADRFAAEEPPFPKLSLVRRNFQALRLPATVWLTASARLEKASGSTILHGDAAKKGQGIMAVVGYARVSTEDQSTEGGKSWIFRSSVALKSSARTLPAPIETLDTKGADFRSLGDPIDTTSPQGRFTLQTVTAERA